MNRLSTMISVLSTNKALEYDKLMITTSEVGSWKFLIACEGSMSLQDNSWSLRSN